ncbi:MAG: hypothetical protein IK093_01825 [Ruminiclostridium sp.]|nr:hypothetical protein [Ruminiclostridium sp.]
MVTKMNIHYDTTTLITTAIIGLIEIICWISIAVNVSKIMKTVTQPFQNKKPDYPDKVLELLQAIVSAEQHNTSEIQSLKNSMEKYQNGGTVPGMKSKETANQEQIIELLKKQNDILTKLLECTNGDEKKKLMEKWKQAQDIMNNM